ncbi:hypothetical protein [Olivibacter sitiensis]|uniref:hypothetical protein n=1 Tax=Olivibacter sitiensis TaxID=376470 RepID=UPI0004872F8E|nr:hypothetical protein [Olivibacter sitiensis]
MLVNFDQLKIKKIAAYHDGGLYYKDFVYVEASGEPQTGLYNITEEDKNRNVDTFGYSLEEYGLFRYNRFCKKTISREHFDDGATVINGKVVAVNDAELRVRYLTDYNFIIAAKGSPYNSQNFSSDSKIYFDGLLQGTLGFDDFFDFLKSFKKRESRG